MLLHLQAGILGKAVGSAIAPPYLLCRSRAALWLAWAILGIASRPFGQDFLSCFLQRGRLEAMADADADAEMFVEVAENPREDVVITLPSDERTSDVPPRWADIVVNEESHMANRAQAVYPAHLLSEVNTFDGVMPETRLGELTDAERLRLFRLNTLPSRPCSARFTLHDNSVDSREIMDRIVATGVPRAHVKCIQRFRSGQVDVTFTRTDSRDLFLSKAGITIRQRPARTRPAWQSGIFVTVWDAPWELPDDLIALRLQEYGEVHSNRRAYNQSLLPEKIHDGRRVLRMTLEKSIPPFIKIGSFLVRIFYTDQPRVCWKCQNPDHIGRDCPSSFCFNCDRPGHKAHDCDEHIKCSLCKSENHLAIDCAYNWGRRTRAQRTPQRTVPEDESTPLDLGQESDDQEQSEASDDRETEQETGDEDLSASDGRSESMSQEDPVSPSIEEFTSSDTNADAPLPQRKRGGNVETHPQKRTKTDENPP